MNSLIPWKRGQIQRNGEGTTHPVSQMRSDWDRLFDRILDDVWGGGPSGPQAMRLDLAETDEQIQICAEVPGIAPEKLNISLSGDVLTLSGEKLDEERTQDGAQGRYYSERHFGTYQRAIKLPCPVDPDHVTAEHKNDVVTITLQKAETVRPRRIKVRSS